MQCSMGSSIAGWELERGAGQGGAIERCRAGWGAREVQGWVGSCRGAGLGGELEIEVQGWVGSYI